MPHAFRIGDAYHVEPSLNRVTGPRGITRLEPKVMQVLVCLAEHAGDMVTKDRLFASAWADTAVGDDVLTRAISELRRLFEDEPKQPRVIETIPRAGYRLIAPVTHPQADDTQREATVDVSPRHHRALIAGLSVALAIVVIAAAWLRFHGEVNVPAPAPAQVAQLTAFRGQEMSPTFSPDGTQVAFAWNGETEDNFDIYLKFVGSSEVRRITTDAAPDVNPAWSPDGRQIAFVRQRPAAGGGATIQLISPLGGRDRKLSDFPVPIAWPPDSCAIAWSPDGRWIAASSAPDERSAESGGLYLIPVAGGEPRPLTRREPPAWHVAPAFSPDGRRLAYASCDPGARVNAPACDVFLVDLDAGYAPVAPPRRLTRQAFAIQGLTWARDGASIIYDTAGRGPFHLWRVMVAGTRAPERLEVAGVGSRKPTTVVSRDRLAFERRLLTLGVYRVGPGQTPQPVLVSSVFDFEPQFSPDGRRLAFVSRRSGDAAEIWSASADGSGPQQLTHGGGTRHGAPAWSPDGRLIAFHALREDGHWDIWLMADDGGAARQLTTDPGDEQTPTWSRDGRWIYFSSDRDGRLDIWRAPASGGPGQRVTRGGSGVVAYESMDGTAIVYQTAAGDSPLVTMPIAGGPTRQLVGCVKAQGFAVGAAGVYYASCATGPESGLHLLDPTTGRDRVLTTVSEPFLPTAFTVSPDGTTLLVHKSGVADDLMLIENFR